MQIIRDPLTSAAVEALLAEHVADMFATSPAESVHTLDLNQLRAPDMQFWTAWQDDRLLGCVALKRHNAQQAEIKSMRTAVHARGKGVGRALLAHVEQVAQAQGITQLYLETGAEDFFAPARALYESAHFVHCAPFAAYQEDPLSVYMRKDLLQAPDPAEPVQRQLAAYNAKDLAAFVRCYHPQIRVYRMPATQPALEGRTAFSDFYANARFNLPKLQAEVLSRMVVGNKVIDHERVTGLHPTTTEVAVVYEVMHGLIRTVWFYPAAAS